MTRNLLKYCLSVYEKYYLFCSSLFITMFNSKSNFECNESSF